MRYMKKLCDGYMMENAILNSHNNSQHNENFAERFIHNSQSQPNKLALNISHMDKTMCMEEENLSYGELAECVKAYQALWRAKAWQRNDRIIVIIKPSSQLYAIALSLLALGMTPVFIDTGMGREKIKMAIKDANARAIISMKALLKWFWLIPPTWRLERLALDGKGMGFCSLTMQLNEVKDGFKQDKIECVTQDDVYHGLISFTSGSTGRPKGADRTHYSLIQQHLAIRKHWPDNKTDIDCPCFPVMVLHNLSCGMTTVMPKVDLAQPAQVAPAQVIQQIKQHKITRLSGAPAYIQALVDYSIKHKECNESIKTLVVGGATVSVALAKGILIAFPNAYSRIVYGSTEAEPIASIEISSYLAHANQYDGYLVGKPAEQVSVLIANIPKGEITEQMLLKQRRENGEVGEILVSGEHVLKQYVDNPAANAENKIKRVQGIKNNQQAVWHRTGDTGFLDSLGRLWLTGRVNDTLEVNNKIIQPYPLEQAIDELDGIVRSALIKFNHELYVFIETHFKINSPQVVDDIKKILTLTGITNAHIKTVKNIPVDGRHNSKIDRVALRKILKKIQ